MDKQLEEISIVDEAAEMPVHIVRKDLSAAFNQHSQHRHQ
jgi:hypothetical protein